jgi:hypothetical protein
MSSRRIMRLTGYELVPNQSKTYGDPPQLTRSQCLEFLLTRFVPGSTAVHYGVLCIMHHAACMAYARPEPSRSRQRAPIPVHARNSKLSCITRKRRQPKCFVAAHANSKTMASDQRHESCASRALASLCTRTWPSLSSIGSYIGRGASPAVGIVATYIRVPGIHALRITRQHPAPSFKRACTIKLKMLMRRPPARLTMS